MAQTYGFFNSINSDRVYNADQMSEYFDGLVSDGVYATIGGAMQVISDSGMNVQVKSGRAIIGSKWLKNDAALTVAVSQSHPTLNRYTAIVIRLNYSARTVGIYAKDGTPASTAAKPVMQNDDQLKELCLAYIYVKAGATSISQSNITDMRASELCGWVTGLVKQVDTSELFLQWQTAYEEYYQSFVEWFNHLTKTLQVNTKLHGFRKYDKFATAGAHYYEIADGFVLGYTFDLNDVINVYINGLLGQPEVDYELAYAEEGTAAMIIPTATAKGTEIVIEILKSEIGNPMDGGSVVRLLEIENVARSNSIITVTEGE